MNEHEKTHRQLMDEWRERRYRLAMAALTGLMSSYGSGLEGVSDERLVKTAFRLADAMHEEGEKPERPAGRGR